MNNNSSVINYHDFKFEESTIIKPKLQEYGNHIHASMQKTLIINSDERNKLVYPTPQKYSVDMVTDFQDMLAFEMLVTDLAFNPYNVRQNNNEIVLTIGNSTNPISTTIQSGLYDSTSLCNIIENTINNTVISTTFVVAYDQATKHFKFTSSSSAFTLINQVIEGQEVKYPENGFLKALGFGCKVYTSIQDTTSGQWVIESEYAATVFDDRDTIVMHIDAMQVNQGLTTVVNKSYAVLHKNGYESHKRVIRKTFNPPLARLNKLNISFYDITGKPYDFQNRDHIIEFNVELHKHARKYHAYLAD